MTTAAAAAATFVRPSRVAALFFTVSIYMDDENYGTENGARGAVGRCKITAPRGSICIFLQIMRSLGRVSFL